MKISIIAAIGENRELGKAGDLIWKIPDDMRNFKALTMGHAIVMGRKTWDSIGRPLPGRKNIIISRNQSENDKDVYYVKSIEEAIKLPHSFGESELFVIGGETIYTQMLPLATHMYISQIHAACSDADVFFPEFMASDWNIIKTVEMIDYNKIKWSIVSYSRN